MQYSELSTHLQSATRWQHTQENMLPERAGWLDAYWEAKISGRGFWRLWYRFWGWIKDDEIELYLNRTFDRLRGGSITESQIKPGEKAILEEVARGGLSHFTEISSPNFMRVVAVFQAITWFPQHWVNLLTCAIQSCENWLTEHPVQEIFEVKDDELIMGDKSVDLNDFEEKLERYQETDWFEWSERKAIKSECDYDFDKFHHAYLIHENTLKLAHYRKIERATRSEIANFSVADRYFLALSHLKDFEARTNENKLCFEELEKDHIYYKVFLFYEKSLKKANGLLYDLIGIIDAEDQSEIDQINQREREFVRELSQYQTGGLFVKKLLIDFKSTYSKICTLYQITPQDKPLDEGIQYQSPSLLLSSRAKQGRSNPGNDEITENPFHHNKQPSLDKN